MMLNDLLNTNKIDPKTVLVFRHRPFEPELRRVLPWLAAEKPKLFNAYQQTQGRRVENSMKRAAYIASFIAHGPQKALFIGIYKVRNWKPVTYDEFWRIDAYKSMKKFGMQGFTGGSPSTLLFDLQPTNLFAEWKGKFIVTWPGPERAWFRWAHKNQIPVRAILEESALETDMPAWDQLVLSWELLKVLPNRWQAALSQWRGIYFILDESDGKCYVGAAYGDENILGRWLAYAATGHGGNKQLRKRNAHNFQFSILQRVAPDMDAADVIRLEDSWKDRLHTREFGLNDN